MEMFNLVVQFLIKKIWEFLTYLRRPGFISNICQLSPFDSSAPAFFFPAVIWSPNSSINSLKSSVAPERPLIPFSISLVSTVQDIFFLLFLEQR
jgi:hypothetical protein